MSERYFHGSLSTLKPGDTIHPTEELHKRGMLGQQFSGLTMQYGHLNGVHDMALEDGSRVRRTAVTYHSTDAAEAEDWGGRPLLKSSPSDFNEMAARGHTHVNVYEVEPHNPRRPGADDLHSQHEVVADHAVVKAVHSRMAIDRYCSDDSCGDYIGQWDQHIPKCPTCGARQASG